jgi:hypothetical protein
VPMLCFPALGFVVEKKKKGYREVARLLHGICLVGRKESRPLFWAVPSIRPASLHGVWDRGASDMVE